MQGSNAFEESLLKHMLLGLQLGSASGNPDKQRRMSFLDRKEAIKASADAAMALARGGTRWSRSLIAALYKRGKHKHVVKSMLGEKLFQRITKQDCYRATYKDLKAAACNKISISRRRWLSRRKHACSDHRTVQARRVAKKRVDELKRLVPGGTAMDDHLSFLGETIDYVLALRAQVDAMRRLADHAVHLLNSRSTDRTGIVE